jgi:thiamine biosynthesis lipoprotein
MEEKQKKRLLWQLPFLTLLVIGTILIIRHQQKMPYQKSADFIFGTSYSVI